MPKKYNNYKKRNYKKKKYYNKKKKYYNKNNIVAKINTIGIPDKMIVRLKSVYRSSQITTGTFTQTNIALNSAYDPFQSFTATQPMYYDQLIALYQGVKVYYTFVKFTIINTSGSEPLDFCIIPGIGSSSLTDMMQAREQKNATYALIGSGDGSRDIKIIKRGYRLKNLVNNYNDQSYGTLNNSSDPPNLILLKYCYQNIDASTNVEFQYDIEMIQTVMFSNPYYNVSRS